MSYYQQPGGYPGNQQPPPQGYGQPPHSQSPYPPQQQQGGWNQPPPMQNQQYGGQQGYGAPPPQGGQWGQPPPPQNQQWGPPPPQQGQYQQQYGAPPPQQGQYGAPPPQGYPPQQGYGAPPPGQYGAPPPGQHGAPPPGQYGAPPQGQYGAPPQGPPHGQYGAPPQGQFGGPPQGHFPPTPATLGYDTQMLQAHRPDMRKEAEGLRKAMKGMGTDEKALIKILAKLDPVQANAVREDFSRQFQRDLIADIKSETSSYFEKGLVAIARGPLFNDVYALQDAMKGLGTKEVVLNDVLMGRSNADINAIKDLYQRTFARTLESDLRGDLSAATEQLFVMVAAGRRAEDAAPVLPQQVQQDVTDLQASFGNMISKNSVLACQILTSRNDAQIRAIAQDYQSRFTKSLIETLKSTFSGHMEDALVLLVARAQNRALSDAQQLEDAMAGMGTKDDLLVQRVVRAHWNRQHMQAVRAAYQTKYKKDLINRIKGETRGDYERLMVACVE